MKHALQPRCFSPVRESRLMRQNSRIACGVDWKKVDAHVPSQALPIRSTHCGWSHSSPSRLPSIGVEQQPLGDGHLTGSCICMGTCTHRISSDSQQWQTSDRFRSGGDAVLAAGVDTGKPGRLQHVQQRARRRWFVACGAIPQQVRCHFRVDPRDQATIEPSSRASKHAHLAALDVFFKTDWRVCDNSLSSVVTGTERELVPLSAGPL